MMLLSSVQEYVASVYMFADLINTGIISIFLNIL